LVLAIGTAHPFSSTVIAAEVFATVLSLFLFGSFRYQLDKNALTYGACLVIFSTFFTSWWPQSELRIQILAEGPSAAIRFFSRHLFSLHALDDLIHADTMLFILGLTFFVAVIAQTKVLETISLTILKRNKGLVLPTVTILTALVAVASGVLDGVSMIGLMIRTLVIILALAKTKDDAVVFAVIVSTVITTVCGMWLAYGEPPNLIMKANLHPYLTNKFFISYCLPMAMGSYLIVFWNIRKHLKGLKVDVKQLDVSGSNARAQWTCAISFIPFLALLIAHSRNHSVPLFWSSFAGFAFAFAGIASHREMRQAAISEAKHEYAEYLFLFPLFFSISLLQKAGFFNQLVTFLQLGIETLGVAIIGFVQFCGACFLSALLDNNVVADFASHALHGLELETLHFFAMVQIAGYAVGGCWTHIGSAQSVVAFAFIRREINPNYTPVQWMKSMTPVILELFALMIVGIALHSLLLIW
jgi:Na+/H+ antiporter NhaD/arsenite permease-like protein